MIQELVDFCDSSFAPAAKGLPCGDNPFMSCADCLKEIHFNKDSVRKYDCDNMCYWYVCQNIYRYTSEMVWLLHDKDLGLLKMDSALNICSIGCGPCSELIAIEEYRNKHSLTFEYSYRGFDINSVWSPIQEKLISLSASPKAIKIINGDVFDYYAHTEGRPNMIILNYMLSDMLKYDPNAVLPFIDKLSTFIAGLSFCAVLINDINIGEDDTGPRYYYEDIYNKISQKCGRENIEVKYYHFANSMKNYYLYGNQRATSAILFKVPDTIFSKYKTNTECHSAQMIIIKKKEQTK